MDNIFASLTRGTSFNKKKHGESMKLFGARAKALPKMDLSTLIPSDGDEDLESLRKRSDKKRNRNSSNNNNNNKDNDEDEDYEEENSSDEDSDDSDESDEDNNNTKSNISKDEQLNEFRNKMNIKVKGDKIPDFCATFDDMNINSEMKSVILANIEKSDWKEPTSIQMQAIPTILNGRDVLAAAPTGSGKTAAFVIPVLSKLKGPQKAGIRGLLLAPTKELAEQLYREADRLSAGRRIKICLLKKTTASNAVTKQDKTSFSNFDLLISTPARLLSLIREEVIDLSKIEIVVLDEADKLFELDNHGKNTMRHNNADEVGEDAVTRSSFLCQIDEIFNQISDKNVQKALFSATFGPQVQELASNILNNNISITIGNENASPTTIDQKLLFVGREDGKLLALRQLIQVGIKPPVLLFVQSKDRAKELFKELCYDGINVDVIHAERTQQQREDIIKRFRIGEIWILICTDLMARGVDFKGVKMVINYDLPLSSVSYIHRIGRTGRAGKEGTAITYFTESDMSKIRSIANVVKLSGSPVPDWMLSINKMTTKQRRQMRESAPERRNISTTSKYDINKAKHKSQMINQSKESFKKKRKV
jgi:ATP-dependent RNA helicase DDX52/ROK1